MFSIACFAESDRFKIPTGEVVPKPENLQKWSDDCSCIPNISEKEIYNYVVLKKESKRQLKSRGYYEDKHVFNIQVLLAVLNMSIRI